MYITTHGNHLIDVDGFIWDDMLNFVFIIIRCKELCLIVDRCYSGGFNDILSKIVTTIQSNNAESFAKGFAEELTSPGRVVFMFCQENEVSYGSDFSNLLISGFQDSADFWGNKDGINSAEESFEWVKFWSELAGNQHPTILDNYLGEFSVTYS